MTHTPDFPYAEFIQTLMKVAMWDVDTSFNEIGTIFDSPDRRAPTPLGADQLDMAAIYGVKLAVPLTNGITQGNMLAVSAVARPGQKILLQRNSHVSAYAPLYNIDLTPSYIYPRHVAEWDVCTGITPDQVDQALRLDPEIKIVFLTSPDYLGIVGDLAGVVNAAHRHGALVIVDAAHGAYYNFYPQMPMPGAAEHTDTDLITHSTHKTLSALSQGSLLLVNNVDVIPALYNVMNRFGAVSSSLSYPILMSISIAVAQMNLHGKALIEQAIQVAARLRSQIQAIDGLRCFELNDILEPGQGICGLDPLRVTVNIAEWGLTGYEVARRLAQQEGITPELATWNQVLFTLTPFDSEKHAAAIVTALQRLALTLPRSKRLNLPVLPVGEQRFTPRDAYYHPRRRWLPVKQAAGKTSGETISACPPEIPVLVEGEAISNEVLEYLDMVRGAGSYLKGLSDPTFNHIWVIDD